MTPSQDISPELVERLVKAARDVVKAWGSNPFIDDNYKALRAIVAELPEPIDPDLLEARKLACVGRDEATAKGVMAGEYDGWTVVQYHLAGIKRGRELARQS